MAIGPYNDIVRARFENPVHALQARGDYPVTVSARAGESENGCRLLLWAAIDRGRIVEMRFRAWGCPFLIASAETACAEMEGKGVDALGTVSANDLAARLSVPAERLGRLFLVEDAAAGLLDQCGA